MMCPICGAESNVLSTRPGKNMTTTRRRECFNMHRFTTIEIYQQVHCSAKRRAAVFSQTVRDRIAIRKRDISIAKRFSEGAQKLMDEFNLSRSGVYLAAKRGRGYLRSLGRG